MKKSIFALALVLGATTAAFAEDSSSSFSINVYPRGAQTQAWEGRNVALQAPTVVNRAQTTDRAGNPYAGGI